MDFIEILTSISRRVGNFGARFADCEKDSDGSVILGLIIVIGTLSAIGFIAAWLR